MYTINEDGTVTRNAGSHNSSSPQPSGGSDGNTGCWVTFIIVVVIGIIVFALVNKNEDLSSQEVAEEPAYEKVVDAEDANDVVTYISISSTSASFDADGGYYTFTVNSNSSWNISTDTYEWGHLSRSGNQLTLRVDANNSSDSRTDYFCIKADGIEKRINIIQDGTSSSNSSTEVSGTVRSIWVDHNVSDSYGNKGLEIHVKFDINGMLNRRGQAAAYFYYTNGNPLKDTNGRCYTSNGNVATHVDFTPNYENCTFNDLSIFMPYSELHMNKSASCYFTISLWCGNNEVTQSDKTYFDINFE